MVSINVPEGITAKLESGALVVTGKLGSNTRSFNQKLVSVNVESGSVSIEPNDKGNIAKKANMAAIAFASEVRNDIKGVAEPYVIKMDIVFSHFPMTVEVSGHTISIKNMLGERFPRTAKIAGDTKVEVKGKEVHISGTKREDVSQTAANIRKTCKVKGRDERIFQDGIYYSIG